MYDDFDDGMIIDNPPVYTRTRSNWIETYTGKPFWPFDPRPEEIHLADIAHALSMQCRFTGHCKRYYSVAEHSVLASRLVPDDWRREALLHDAAEAYIHDMASPIKGGFGGYKEAEDKIDTALITRFGLKAKPWPEIKAVDHRLVVTERQHNLAPCDLQWDPVFDNVDPYLSLEFPYCGPLGAEYQFLTRAKELGIT